VKNVDKLKMEKGKLGENVKMVLGEDLKTRKLGKPKIRKTAKSGIDKNLRDMLRAKAIGMNGECTPGTTSGESGTAKMVGRCSTRILGTGRWIGEDRIGDRLLKVRKNME